MIKRIKELLAERDRVIVGLDGGSCSGKSTLATQVSLICGGGVIHMDDFFLPLEMRTAERLRKPGGNVHYERFLSEVAAPLAKGESFSYRAFDCASMDYGRQIAFTPGRLVIIEGAYCLLPQLAHLYDFKVFMRISPKEQCRRVFAREGERAERFLSEWIPMENNYFSAFEIAKNCDMIIEV